jgi:hypothetical protein
MVEHRFEIIDGAVEMCPVAHPGDVWRYLSAQSGKDARYVDLHVFYADV